MCALCSIFPAGEGKDDVRIVRRCVREDGGMLIGWFKTAYTSVYGQEHEKEEVGENGKCAHAIKPRDCFC